MKSWVPIPILIPVNRGANPGYFPHPGRIGIPRFPGIPAKSGSGQNPEYFPDPGPIGIGKIPAIFPAKSGRGGAGRGGIRGFRVWFSGLFIGEGTGEKNPFFFSRMTLSSCGRQSPPWADEARQCQYPTYDASTLRGVGPWMIGTLMRRTGSLKSQVEGRVPTETTVL